MTNCLERLQREDWWTQPYSEKPELSTVLLHLCEVLESKKAESYESACTYVSEIVR